MISAPSEMRCMSMWARSIAEKTIASVSGIASATTSPGRTPSATKLTARMIATACQSDSMNSAIAVFTVTAWSETSSGWMPIGRLAVASAIAFSRF